MGHYLLYLFSRWALALCWPGGAPQRAHCGEISAFLHLLPQPVLLCCRSRVFTMSGPMLHLPFAPLLQEQFSTKSGAVYMCGTATESRTRSRCICSSSATGSVTAATSSTWAW